MAKKLTEEQLINQELEKRYAILVKLEESDKRYLTQKEKIISLEQRLIEIEDAKVKKAREASPLFKQIENTIKSNVKLQNQLRGLEASAVEDKSKQLDLENELLGNIQSVVDSSGNLNGSDQRRLDTIMAIKGGQNDVAGVTQLIAEQEAEIARQNENFLMGASDAEKDLLKLLNLEKQRLEKQELSKAALGEADKVTGGLASKAKDFANKIVTKPKLAALGIAGALVGLIVTAVTQFSKKIDEVGKSFGFLTNQNKEFRNDLIDAGNEAMMVGKNLGDVLAVTSQLSSEFGVALTEADDLARTVLDTAVATGLSNDEATKLFGTFMQIGNLTAKQAEDLIEGTAQLAAQEGVAPTAVLQDLAGSAEEIAAFTKDSGENIAEAAIQARKLGLSLQTTAKIADNLLDFENSITNEIQASVMIGKQLNFQKARQLALDNDIAGAVKEVVNQLGSEEEFNNLNRLQRKALADSIGVSVAEMAKLVGQTDKLTLSGAMAGKNFDDLVGQDALSGLSSIINSLKMVGAAVLDEIGKPIAGLLKDFQENIMTPEGMKDLKNTLVSIVNSVIGIINGIGSIAGFFTDIEIAKIPTVSLPTAQTGISGFSGGEIMVGETGPERVSLPRGSSVMSAEQTRQSAGGSEIDINPLIEATKETTRAISNLNITAGRGEIRVAMEPQMGGNL